MVILGLHKDPWHNTSAAVIADRDGSIQFANLSEERCNREKDSREFPTLATAACLDAAGVSTIEDVDTVVLDYIVNKDWRQDYFSRPCKSGTFLESIPENRITVINHHLAHAYSTFYSSGFKSAAVLVVDGRGSDKETQSLFMADQSEIKLLASTCSIGVGLLYSTITQAIGFGLLQEGKTMGLAPYGAEFKQNIFSFPKKYNGITTDYSDICVDGSYGLKVEHPTLDTIEKRSRAAYEVQRECEEAMIHLAEYAYKKTGAEYLCISGGVGLNSVSNYKVLQARIFTDVYINPAASDTGIALGCALYGYHNIAGKPRSYSKISPFLGPEYTDADIISAIDSYRGTTSDQDSYEGFDLTDHSPLKKSIRLLANNKIVACFNGRSEIGPRALGNRSILMSPLVAKNKDFLNARVKHRESFRPFAPAILEEYTEEYFEIDRPSPYMLFVPYVKEDKRPIIPAVTHYDGTGRLQTVNRKDHPRFYALIDGFRTMTGVPVILNTSFNVAGEPIVESPHDAISCFRSTDIDALLIGRYLLTKPSVIK
jgi:carbamoyltransferase